MTNLAAASAPDTLWHRYDDPAGQHAWVAAHDIRHRTYRKAISRTGVTLQSAVLTGDVDADWFARHMLAHIALKSLFPIQIGQQIPTLGDDDFDDQQSFDDWMHRHALIHARLDTALGVV